MGCSKVSAINHSVMMFFEDNFPCLIRCLKCFLLRVQSNPNILPEENMRCCTQIHVCNEKNLWVCLREVWSHPAQTRCEDLLVYELTIVQPHFILIAFFDVVHISFYTIPIYVKKPLLQGNLHKKVHKSWRFYFKYQACCANMTH